MITTVQQLYDEAATNEQPLLEVASMSPSSISLETLVILPVPEIVSRDDHEIDMTLMRLNLKFGRRLIRCCSLQNSRHAYLFSNSNISHSNGLISELVVAMITYHH